MRTYIWLPTLNSDKEVKLYLFVIICHIYKTNASSFYEILKAVYLKKNEILTEMSRNLKLSLVFLTNAGHHSQHLQHEFSCSSQGDRGS